MPDPYFTLNTDALQAYFTDPAWLEDTGDESIDDVTLSSFSDTLAKAVEDLVYRAFGEAEALVQPEGSELEVIVYPIMSATENPMLVTVRPTANPSLVQAASYTLDADRLVDLDEELSGMELLVGVLEGVLFDANRIVNDLRAMVAAMPAG